MFGKIIVFAIQFVVRVLLAIVITKVAATTWTAMKTLWNARTIRVVLEK